MSYTSEAREAAADAVRYFKDEVIDQIMEEGEASSDLLNDYSRGDEYHHGSHVDKSYTLTEAAELLDDLSDHEETDSGLWEGLEPRRAIEAQAAYTFGNAVMAEFCDLIDDINAAAEEAASEIDERHAEEDAAQDEKLAELKARAAELEEDLDDELTSGEREAAEAELADVEKQVADLEDADEDEREEARKAEKREAVEKAVDATCDSFDPATR